MSTPISYLPSTQVIMNDYFSAHKPYHVRHASTSSQASSSGSRSPSPQSLLFSALPPAPSAFSPYPSPPLPAISTSSKERLHFVPSSMADAQAAIVVTSSDPASSSSETKGRAVLVMGQGLQQIRSNPARSLAKGARVHPYRIVRGPPSTLRGSSSPDRPI